MQASKSNAADHPSRVDPIVISAPSVNASATAYNSSSPSSVSITTTVAGCLIYAAISGWATANTFSVLTGFTPTTQTNG